MRDLITKLETLQSSKVWQDHIQALRDGQVEQNAKLLWSYEGEEYENYTMRLYSLADFLRHEVKFLNKLYAWVDIKDKSTRESVLDGIQRNIDGRINVLLWKTREFKMDNIIEWESYTEADLWRTENYWIERLERLPLTLAEEERQKELKREAEEQAQIQENLDALSVLESEGL